MGKDDTDAAWQATQQTVKAIAAARLKKERWSLVYQKMLVRRQ